MAGIDGWLPRFDVGERHEVLLAVPEERALRATLAAPAAPDALVRLLFRLRGLTPDGSIEEFLAANRFTVLERTPTTCVVGIVVRGARLVPSTAATWTVPAGPWSLRIATDFRAEPGPGGGARVITETRVIAAGAPSRLVFRLYWLVVGPFSRLIRRRWLRAAAARP